MARRKRELDRIQVGPDPVYGSELVQRLVNVIMERGKKNIARNIVYGTIDILAKKSQGDKTKALEFFNKAFWQIVPAIEVRSRRVGGGVYQIPREVTRGRGCSLAMRWLIEAASERPGKNMQQRLANELMDAYEGRGSAIKKKTDVHKMAEANRAFSHYAW
ncbi:MAG TPA: 30S ribosomal protein S7 [Candidatus Limnocylindria bacterium]|nr:30S ribosomal protein S7 [Candidatus Limnocylindria bacterium]